MILFTIQEFATWQPDELSNLKVSLTKWVKIITLDFNDITDTNPPTGADSTTSSIAGWIARCAIYRKSHKGSIT